MRVAILALLAGCAFGIDGGVLQHPELSAKGGSVTAHAGFGGGGQHVSPYILAFDLDTRVDVASGGSRWTAGASAQGGVRLGGAFATGRVGIWRAIVSGAEERAAVPSLEAGVFIPVRELYDPDPAKSKYGSSASGIAVGAREDFDITRYFTVFVGYAVYILPGY